jgi:DNA uptake protein ComE-like DNA-binding protein
VIFNFSKKVIKEFFSFSRSELRGVAFLVILLILVISIRIYLASKNNKISFEIVKSESHTQITTPPADNSEQNINDKKTKILKLFNPNTIDYNGLIELGLDKKVSQHIINYRNKGGKFNVPGDLLKIYDIDSSVFLELLPYIDIPVTVRNDRKNPELNIDLNTADTNELKKIPGIGNTLSKRILKYRTMLGGFYTTRQLTEVYGINDSLFNTFSRYVHADTNYIRCININTCKFEDLDRHPYITNYQAKAIQSFRKLSGLYTHKKQLLENYLLSDESYSKIAPYLTLN